MSESCHCNLQSRTVVFPEGDSKFEEVCSGNLFIPEAPFSSSSISKCCLRYVLAWIYPFAVRTVNKFILVENEYYEAFNSLLSHLFPTSEYYQVSPQRVADSRNSTTILVTE